jgi:peptide/nickel transport system permease protein
MADLSLSQTENIQIAAHSNTSAVWLRFGRYFLIKLLTLLVTVTIGVYLSIVIANYGGYLDTIFRGQIAEAIAGMEMAGTWDHITDPEEKTHVIEETIYAMEEARGLHYPFLGRTFSYLWNSMTLGLGESFVFGHGYSSGFSTSFLGIKDIILERLPYTLLLFVSANVLTFVAGLFLALILSRKSGGWVDRIVILFSALASAPAWIHGATLVIVLAAWLRWLPFPHEINLMDTKTIEGFVSLVLPELILPVLAVFASTFFQTIYVWRTYFLIYSEEDYVEMGRAKGLPDRVLERRYILRPSLPYVITNFSLMVMGLWQGSMALELLFNWPGIGLLFLRAIRTHQVALVVGVVVIFAYLLAFTVFLLDIVYALVDPRVTIGGQSGEASQRRSARLQHFSLRKLFFRHSGQSAPRQPLQKNLSWHFPQINPITLYLSLQMTWQRLKVDLFELRRYPSAIFGLMIIGALATLAIYTVISMPYKEAIVAWRGHEADWFRNPRYAKPAWVNHFRSEKLPVSTFLHSQDPNATRTETVIDADMREIEFIFPLHYEYSRLPQNFFIKSTIVYDTKLPLISLSWIRPDGEEIDLGGYSPKGSGMYYPLTDDRVQRRLRGQPVMEALFGGLQPIPGDYQLKAYAYVFEPDSNVEIEVILQGEVHGLAGTDQNRRDILFAIQWGSVVALVFGLLGAVATNIIAMLLAATGVWLSGWVDALIQRITEVIMILPVLPIAILVFYLYSKTIWVILGVVVLLAVFSTSLKNYRAAFLQIKSAAYIEAAQAYGASNGRIIFQYLVPRILPVLAPQLVIMVPGYIYYEATLAYLGVSDPYLPTWGKVIYEALTNNALQTHPHWLLIPLAFMVISGLGFALLSFALDKILNPRLRSS